MLLLLLSYYALKILNFKLNIDGITLLFAALNSLGYLLRSWWWWWQNWFWFLESYVFSVSHVRFCMSVPRLFVSHNITLLSIMMNFVALVCCSHIHKGWQQHLCPQIAHLNDLFTDIILATAIITFIYCILEADFAAGLSWWEPEGVNAKNLLPLQTHKAQARSKSCCGGYRYCH